MVSNQLKRNSGQVMIESILVAAVVLSMVTALSILLYTVKDYGGRSLDLVASDYP